MSNSPLLDADLVIGVTPAERADPRLAAAIAAAGALGVIDLTRGGARSRDALATLRRWTAHPFGVRLARASDLTPADLLDVSTIILSSDAPWQPTDFADDQRVLIEVTDIAGAVRAMRSGAAGLIARGGEAGGRAGELGTFVLLQQLLADPSCAEAPIWACGGIGPRTAAASVMGGAVGVVLDTQLALLAESDLDADSVRAIRTMDGTEPILVSGYRVMGMKAGPGSGIAELSVDEVVRRLQSSNPSDALIPVGQDGFLAARFARQFGDVATTVKSIREAILDCSEGATMHGATALGTALPVAQGPMTRVSDQPEFAAAVAAEGALPFIALALADAGRSRDLLTRSRDLLGNRPWGAGILGFVPEELRAAQLSVIREVRPTHVIIAGGRPAQAAELEKEGISTFIHVPSPVLLDQYLRNGARKFVFEGAECGGHVGPRNSFPLWEAQIGVLIDHLAHAGEQVAAEISILFAGGIHDERSAAMVATLAAPLSERGVGVGVLMGTAYLFTTEAVANEAVGEVFQKQVAAATHTELLETAPGHSTRCVSSPFTREFAKVRDDRRAADVSEREIWAELEALNVGRLRIASKAVERVDSGLVPVDEGRQLADGLFMAGQVSVLRSATTTVADLHRAVTVGAEEFLSVRSAAIRAASETGRAAADVVSSRDIAIVGMACLFPNAPDLASYWSNIVNGVDAVTEVPHERWDPEIYFKPDGQDGTGTLSKWGGFLPGIPFDALRYGIPPAALASIEPVQLLALEVARRALDDAFGTRSFARERTSVVFGAEAGSDLANAVVLRAALPAYYGKLPEALDAELPQLTADSFPGMLANVISGRIANRLDLGGANYIVDAACASSLAAVDIARKELLGGASDVVLCGGADLHNGIGDYLLFSSVHALSPSGHSRPFDHKADGIGLGEGVACVVLKRLADAQREGDRIYAVIKGVGAASDGKSLGLTAPRKEGQRAALVRAYEDAGLSPASVSLVEAHGTGTVVGDRTELGALTEMFTEADAMPGGCTLGSVKSQIGHTKCAAGLAGLVKTAMALHTRVLPPTGNIERPNPAWDKDTSPFVFSTRVRPWSAPSGERLAGVSAFGFGGTNFHVVLAEHPSAPPRTGMPQWPAELFVFCGKDPQAARSELGRLADLVGANNRAGYTRPLRDFAATAASRAASRNEPVQVALIARDLDELDDLLRRALLGEADPHAGLYIRDGSPYVDPNAESSAAFLFPGQGSQSPGMFGELFTAFPNLHQYLAVGRQWAPTMFPPTAFDERTVAEQAAAITDTGVAQPTLGIAGLAAHHLLTMVGIRPDMAAGHSYGELVALCASGAFDAETLLALSAARAEAIVEAAGDTPGGMAAVALGADRVAGFLVSEGLDGWVCLANINTPQQTVISGHADAIDAAVERFRAAGHGARRIPVACAFHSPAVAGASDRFAEVLAGERVAAGTFPVFTNRAAHPYSKEPDEIRRELAAQIAAPVRFADEIEAMYSAGARIFVEAGPGNVLSRFADTVLGDRPHLAVAIQPSGSAGGLRGYLDALARLAVAGIRVQLDALFHDRAIPVPADAAFPVRPGWLVDGHLVRSADGQPLPGGLRPARRIVEPNVTYIEGNGTNGNGHTTGEQREQLVADFLRSSRDMLAAQRDVLLTYLGTTNGNGTVLTSAPAPVAVPAPVVVQAPPLPSALAALPEPVADTVSASTAAKIDVAAVLREVISERTGYPADMIEPDLDLEADLSIDSIKRMEIAAQLVARVAPEGTQTDDADLEDLSRARTAAAITSWLTEHLAPAESAPEPQAISAAASSALATPVEKVDVAAVLREVISERTGYPADMIEPDLDLEADLSIDSIKRMEIAAQLVARVAPEGTQTDDADLEDLSRARTAAAITLWLTEHLTPGETRSDAELETPVIALEPAAGERPSRYLWQTVRLEDTGPSDAAGQLTGRRILILGANGELAGALETDLVAHGAAAVIRDSHDFADQYDGVIYLTPIDDPENPALPEMFAVLQSILSTDVRALVIAAPLVSLDDVAPRSPSVEGLRGLLRTTAREFPEVNVKIVETDELDTPTEASHALIAELLTHDHHPVILRSAGSRQILSTHRVDLGQLAESGAGPADDGTAEARALGLDSESVILIVGGARGITARVATAMATASRCRLVLAGRTPLPTEPEGPETASARTLEDLRAAFVARGQMPIRQVEKMIREILAQREITDTLAAVRRAGGHAVYRTLDVLDAEATRRLVKEVHQEYGRLDGVVYGAGITVDQLVSRTTMDSFRLVYDTKVAGATALLDAAAELPTPPGFAVLFGSVATVIGSRGQVGYAAANDVMETIGHSWAARTGTRAVTIHWGPWAPVGIHAGMVSPELQRDFASRDLALIDPDEGPMCLLRELAWGDDGNGSGAATVIYAPSGWLAQ